MTKRSSKRDLVTAEQQIRAVLLFYKRLHPAAKTKFYRYNTACIRIVDPRFADMSRSKRDKEFWKFAEPLSDDAYTQITLLVLLTPDEVQASWVNYEFEHPLPSTV